MPIRLSREESAKLMAMPGVVVGPSVQLPDAPAKRSKYGAVKTTIDGVTFASKREAKRYLELVTLEAAGKIKRLTLQPQYDLHAKGGEKVGRYTGDFRYIEGGKVVVEDCKGYKTRDYQMRKRHMKAEYGIVIRET